MSVYTEQDLRHLSIHALARIIGQNWSKVTQAGTPSAFGSIGQHPANPYWQAMSQMQSVEDSYGYDSGREIVLRFLGNATGWRGETARLVKAELKRRLAQ